MEKLKVGDVVIKEQIHFMQTGTVVRLTTTQAILDNGIRIVNEPLKYYDENVAYFKEYGSKFDKWQILTGDIKERIEEIKQMKKIKAWFKGRMFNFTDIELKKIHDLLNKENGDE